MPNPLWAHYGCDYFRGLAQRFDFDESDPELNGHLARAAHYLWFLDKHGDSENTYRQDEKRKVTLLLRDLSRFKRTLADWSTEALEGIFSEDLAARVQQIEPTRSELRSGLLEGLDILAAGLVLYLEPLRAPGRPRNSALEGYVLQIAMVWTVTMGRKFTVDHHHGSGFGEAFEFVRALAKPLSPSTNDQMIVTTMRKVVTRLRKPQLTLEEMLTEMSIENGGVF
jgi:hypothetical protein